MGWGEHTVLLSLIIICPAHSIVIDSPVSPSLLSSLLSHSYSLSFSLLFLFTHSPAIQHFNIDDFKSYSCWDPGCIQFSTAVLLYVSVLVMSGPRRVITAHSCYVGNAPVCTGSKAEQALACWERNQHSTESSRQMGKCNGLVTGALHPQQLNFR